MVSNFLQVMVD
uniref:Uncharacterized protein n=1 Tax=Arundo donax TaxID=35708 RepID=A0A0A9GUS5_ARUDO